MVLTSKGAVDTVANAFEGQDVELIRSDKSVEQEDQLRAAFSDPADTGPPRDEHHQPPGGSGTDR